MLDSRAVAFIAVVGQRDVHGVRVAEQVVHVAEDLLVRADQEHAQVVRLAVEGVERDRFLDVAAVDELFELAVGIAGDVADHRVVDRAFGRAGESASPGTAA